MFRAVALLVLLAGCSHVSPSVPASTRYDAMTDEQVANLAIHESLGSTDITSQISGITGETRAFITAEERVAFEARVQGLIHAATFGNRSRSSLLRACERNEAMAPRASASTVQRACGDFESIHTVVQRPALHRAYLEALLPYIHDPVRRFQVGLAFNALHAHGSERYVFTVDRWELPAGPSTSLGLSGGAQASAY